MTPYLERAPSDPYHGKEGVRGSSPRVGLSRRLGSSGRDRRATGAGYAAVSDSRGVSWTIGIVRFFFAVSWRYVA
jgi:hypothetical protein